MTRPSRRALTVIHPDTDERITREGCLDTSRGFSLLFDGYGERVFTHLYLLIRNRETARDLVQEVFLRAWKEERFFREGMDYRAWLITVASRLGLNHLRDSRRSGELLRRLSGDSPGLRDPMKLAVESVAEEELWTSLQRLPARYREAMILKYHEGLKVSEIAQVLQTKEGTVLTLLFRGRLILKRRLTHGSTNL